MDKNFKICIDLMNSHVINGWFINLLSPENKEISLYINGDYQGITQANKKRYDVKKIYDELTLDCGFSFDLSRFPNFKRLQLKSCGKTIASAKNNNFKKDKLRKLLYAQDRYKRVQQLNVDLTSPIHGDNWYDIEPTGRWAGPKLESTLTIPSLEVGTYQLELNIANHFCNLAAMKLILNDKLVKFSNTLFPATVTLQAEVNINKVLPYWKLHFKFLKIDSPNEDEFENRHLAIFLKTLTFTKK